jgi:nucleoside-diphosphate kinase
MKSLQIFICGLFFVKISVSISLACNNGILSQCTNLLDNPGGECYQKTLGYRQIHLLGERVNRTLAIIKPDAVERNITGKILEKIESAGFTIVGIKKIHLGKSGAEGFYHVHRERPFFNDLCTYMSRSPVVILVLEKQNAIPEWRKLMGSTNPEAADPGTIRKEFGLSLGENSVHGSDSTESAAYEIPYFFSQLELA